MQFENDTFQLYFCLSMIKASSYLPMHMRTASVLLLAHVVFSTLVDIAGVDRPVLFSKLYRKALSLRSRRSIFSPSARKIDAERARVYVGKYVSALNGVEMGICVPSERDGDCMDAGRYDAMYGEGAAESVVAMARTFSRKMMRRRSRGHCCSCCSNLCNHVAENKMFCTYQVLRILGSIVATKVGYVACGPPGALAIVCCCMVCGGVIDGACHNCYYKGLRFRNILEDQASAVCAKCCSDYSMQLCAKCTGLNAL
eukprot:jgi/Antlo1/1846/1347